MEGTLVAPLNGQGMTGIGFTGADPTAPLPTRPGPFLELGATGLKRTGGYVNEEFLPQLSGRRARMVYREMSSNDAITGGQLRAIKLLLRQAKWRVEPGGTTTNDVKAAELITQCQNDMSHTWEDFVVEAGSMLEFGWSAFELVYKKRQGPMPGGKTPTSFYNDGFIGWRKFGFRSQDSLLHWVYSDEDEGLAGLVQLPPPKYRPIAIPIEKLLLFRPSTAKNNPEGESILRQSYRSWYLKKKYEEIEAIGIERDLAGLPVGRVPASLFHAPDGTPEAEMLAAWKKMVRQIRRDEQEGIVLPTAFDHEGKGDMYSLDLLSSGGGRSFDINGTIVRLEQRQLLTTMQDFLLLGTTDTGSYAMHADKTGLFRTALNSYAQAIASVLNRYAIPRLLQLNSIEVDVLPKFVVENIAGTSLTELGSFMQSMSALGVQWFPDATLEEYIREVSNLPKMSADQEQAVEVAAAQQQVLADAQRRVEGLTLQAQAGMALSGQDPNKPTPGGPPSKASSKPGGSSRPPAGKPADKKPAPGGSKLGPGAQAAKKKGS